MNEEVICQGLGKTLQGSCVSECIFQDFIFDVWMLFKGRPRGGWEVRPGAGAEVMSSPLHQVDDIFLPSPGKKKDRSLFFFTFYFFFPGNERSNLAVRRYHRAQETGDNRRWIGYREIRGSKLEMRCGM